MKRVVLDTNIWVSALLVKVGKPAQIINAAYARLIVLLTSEDILAETEHTLHLPRITKRYNLTASTIHTFLTNARNISTVVTVRTTLDVVKDDPEDNKILACAVDGKASYLVTGDPDLLAIGEYKGVRILTPAQFLELFQQVRIQIGGQWVEFGKVPSSERKKK